MQVDEYVVCKRLHQQSAITADVLAYVCVLTGVICVAKRDQISPVAVTATC